MSTEELGALLGARRKVDLSSGTIEVQPLKLKQFGQLLGVLPPAIAGLFGSVGDLAAWARLQGLVDESNELVISAATMGPLFQELLRKSAMLPEAFDALITAMAIASEMEKRKVEQLDLADSMKLGQVLWEMNADFFVQSVWPAVTKLMSPTSGPLSMPPKRGQRSETAPAGRTSSPG